MFLDVYRGAPVLITGHSGFKGAWLGLWLHQLGAQVHGFGGPPPTQPSLFHLLEDRHLASETRADITDAPALAETLRRCRPRFVFHLAAQPLVRASYADPMATLRANVMGTATVLEALRAVDHPCTALLVTTDKCYQNPGHGFACRETDPLGGDDVYSASKAAAEWIVHAWRQSFFQRPGSPVALSTVRAGNVIGGGDWAADRLLPDAVRARLGGEVLRVRNPQATRPWQHVLDCLSGYLWLGARLHTEPDPPTSPLASAFNFGPMPHVSPTVADVLDRFHAHFPGEWRPEPQPGAPKEAPRLAVAIDRAVHLLRWRPTWDLDRALAETGDWYRRFHLEARPDPEKLSLECLHRFQADARAMAQDWACPAPHESIPPVRNPVPCP